MSFQISGATLIGGISTNVSITSGFPVAGTGQTAITKTSSKAGQSITAGTGALLYTVTGGKTFYMTQLTMGHRQDTSSRGVEIRDGTTIAGTLKQSQMASANGYPSDNQIFVVPIPFTAGVYVDLDTTCTQLVWSFSGFEA